MCMGIKLTWSATEILFIYAYTSKGFSNQAIDLSVQVLVLGKSCISYKFSHTQFY